MHYLNNLTIFSQKLSTYISIKEIVNSSIGLMVTLFFGFLVWLLKTAYERRGQELHIIAEVERLLAHNAVVLNDYKFLIKLWMDALAEYKPYVTQYSEFNLGKNIDTVKLDLKFVNQYLPLILNLERLESDTKGIYHSYEGHVLRLISTENQSEQVLHNWKRLNDNLKQILTDILPKIKEYENDLVTTIAFSQLLYFQKKASLFQLIKLLFTNIYPKINKEKIEEQKIKVLATINQKK